MYLFGRTRTIESARLRDALGFVTEITEYVKEKTDLPVSAYNTAFGLDVGTITWSTVVPSHADMSEAMGTLMSDNEYLKRVEKGAQLFTGPAVDQLRKVVDVQGTMDEPPAVCQVITAEVELHNLTRAIQWSVDINHYVSGVSGLPSLFLTDAYGKFGQVTWIGGAPDMRAIDDAEEKLAVDPGYVQRIEETGDLFIHGSGQRALLTRIA